MNLILCLDNRNGISFGGKRQSRDRVVCERILAVSNGSLLRMSSYSAKLFPNQENVVVQENFLQFAEAGDYCFAELEIRQIPDQVSRIILFKWNRDYPADSYFLHDLSNEGWNLVANESFSGYSHDLITMEVYER